MGNDTAQSIIDQIVQSHESGGRAQMFAAPSMRIGAGFMNPMATARESSPTLIAIPFGSDTSNHIPAMSW